MEQVERHLLLHCIKSLIDVQVKLKATLAESLIQKAPSGKEDSLYLDVFPENILQLRLLQDYDRHIVLVTEEKGKFNYEKINEAETVVFSDPTDRSKHLKIFIEAAIARDIISRNSLFGDLLGSDQAQHLWHEVGGAPACLTGSSCSITVVKRGEILFSLILNYITEEIAVASKDRLSIASLPVLQSSIEKLDPNIWKELTFPQPSDEHTYVTYLSKNYRETLESTQLLDKVFIPTEDEPGGPVRILYLSSLNKEPPGFILSNGEKIGEWIVWLAFCRYSEDLVAYSLYPGTTFAKDDILIAPSPPYSILELSPRGSLRLNYEKLKHFENPSRYREMILVTHRNNGTIRATIAARKSRLLFLNES